MSRPQAAAPGTSAGGVVVFGGGTATNSLVDVFESLRATSSSLRGARGSSGQCTLSYVIPISDNGGSSSELIRVFGGPGIGDVRSRLVRLIPDSDTDPERASLKELFNHRLPEDHALARSEWLDIVESRHPLWGPSTTSTSSSSSQATPGSTGYPAGSGGISSEKRELIRSIFNIVNMEIVKRARPSSVFNFSRASIGNLFLTGGRVLTGSLESAVYLLATICGVPEHVRVVPAINSNFTHHISAGLANGDVITGQNSISHPSAPTALPDDGSSRGMMAGGNGGGGMDVDVRDETAMLDLIEDATLPGSLPTLRKPYISFNKGGGALTPLLSTAESSRPGSTGQHTPITGNDTTTPNAARPTSNGRDTLDSLTFDLQSTNIITSSPPQEPQDREPSTTRAPPPPSFLLPGGDHPLPARIDRIWYINPYGHEIWPPANPKVTQTILHSASTVIYSIGSLYTSIVPSLVLRGVGAALASSRTARHKILILNSSLDRETSGRPFRAKARLAEAEADAAAATEKGHAAAHGQGPDDQSYGTDHTGGGGGEGQAGPEDEDFTAADFIRAIVRACVQSQGELPARMARRSSLSYKVRQQQQPPASSSAAALSRTSAPPGGSEDPTSSSTRDGHRPAAAAATAAAPHRTSTNEKHHQQQEPDDLFFFDNPAVVRRYVTHLVYLEAPGAPRVDKKVLAGMGVECVRVYGRREGGRVVVVVVVVKRQQVFWLQEGKHHNSSSHRDHCATTLPG
ncbi:uncharacterized protein B0I36DRAFT_97559 [Microdochium trichocladiopsis]|uniref:Uncharacterized protein n=1 Tax=Microdochium trichocladiopsis TaxID=1682393 RepID=A0A9P8YF59_9PEZI|nr:uncharacterized protein B0I36DRAFT_97559 [Microdochium trichocladiopsis]KAH7035877.1 hypothetical protein B0I36DRAFT_97559 [Microdochium trichocladiopsis]